MDKNVRNEKRKKIYTQNIIRTKHDSAIRYTNNMCNFRAWVWIYSTTWSTNKNKPQKTAFRIQRITIITYILPRILVCILDKTLYSQAYRPSDWSEHGQTDDETDKLERSPGDYAFRTDQLPNNIIYFIHKIKARSPTKGHFLNSKSIIIS